MTTETAQTTTTARVLWASGASASVLEVALVLLALGLAGPAAGLGALVGGGLALVVFLAGSLVVDAVAGLAPSLSLIFALSTYTLQVLTLALVFALLQGSNLLGPVLSSGWLGGAIIAVTLAWLVAQVVLSTRARIPLYDLEPRPGAR